MTHDSQYLGFDPALVGTPLASYRTSSRGELPRGVERVTEGGEEGANASQNIICTVQNGSMTTGSDAKRVKKLLYYMLVLFL